MDFYFETQQQGRSFKQGTWRRESVFEKRRKTAKTLQLANYTTKWLCILQIQKKRILKKCTPVPAPKGKGLTEDCCIYKKDSDNGYVQIFFNGKNEYVHRVALIIFLGVLSFPTTNNNGELVECGHKCDRRRCCEPSHLYLATKAENGKDKTKNGLAQGEKHYNAKIKGEVAQEIKWSKGFETQQERANEFGVSLSIVKNIDRGITWTDLPDRNGKTFEETRVKRNKQGSLNHALVKDIPWTREQLDNAQAKFNTLKYVKIDTSRMFPKENGTYCRLWIRSVDSSGYPHTTISGVGIGAHIVACAIGNGYVRHRELEASHNCGNKLCVNSEHITFKTHKENTADKYEHGTMQFKLSFEQVLDIRKRYANGENGVLLAESYGVSHTTIYRIVNLKTRKLD